MDLNEIYDELERYNDDELFYKELFLSRRQPEKYAELMRSLNIDEVNKRGLIIPELQQQGYRPARFGDDFLDTKEHKNVYLSKHNRYTPPYEHDHDFFEIVYILSGECENRIFGRTDVLRQGDLCLLSPSVKHSIWTEDGLLLNILIRRSTIRNILSNIFIRNTIISDFFGSSIYLSNFATCLMFRTNGDDDIRRQILEMYGEQLRPDEYSENIISSMLMIFFNKLVRGYKDTAVYPQTVKEQNESVAKILGMILSDYAGITLSDLADSLGYSTVYCSKYVKKLTGCTFSELLKKVRLQKAADLLQNTSMSISDISAACGYENPENFNRAFRQRYHTAPSGFRERHSSRKSAPLSVRLS
ncbi:MAG: AraC family transcriptional regulator [Lachnospiraceae bacterium]|nr:AraC family transcriptional regulator [Lachnospiraceae bacterium]